MGTEKTLNERARFEAFLRGHKQSGQLRIRKPPRRADGTPVAILRRPIKGVSMADDLSNRGAPDRDRVNVNEDYELRNWSKKFGVSPEELKRAVAQVGDRADAVRQHLGK
jgi:hypothetical protein